MKRGTYTGVLVVIVIVIIGAFVWYNRNASWLAPLLGSGTTASQQEIAKVSYACDASKTIVATYYTSTGSVQAPAAPVGSNMPPAPNGSVALMLSDGRTMTLPQTISGSGIRYANASESLVFWSKGNTAFVTEGVGNNATTTFANCVAASSFSG